jgi:hypothetical protein
MTVTSEVYRKEYTATGGTEFPFIYILDEAHVGVYADGVLQTLNSDYTVSDVGDPAGATVTFTTAPTSGVSVVLVRTVPYTQLTDFMESDRGLADTKEGVADKLTMIAQQQQEAIDRTLSFPNTSTYKNAIVNTPVIGSYLRWSATSPPTVEATTVTPTSGIGLPLSQVDGGFGQDVAAKTGIIHQYAGVFAWESGTVLVDAFGTAGDGVTDDSTEIQAAIDSGSPRILFNPSKTYYITTALAVALIASDTRREIDGQGCTIKCGGGIANAFLLAAPTGTDQFNYTQCHDFKFSGTVTGAFVKMETGATYWNDFWNLSTAKDSVATATALLEFHNTSATSSPGGFTVRNILAPSKTVDHTILFSKDVAALGDCDDFILNFIQGGGVSTIEVEDGYNVLYADIRNILTTSHGVRTVNTGTVQRSQINRMYLEPVLSAEPTGAITAHYGVTGNFYSCRIESLHAWVADHALYPYASTPVFLAYGTFYDCHLSNISLYSSATDVYGPPYGATDASKTEYYPTISIIGGTRNTIDFPSEYMENGMALGASATIWPVTFVQKHVPRVENVSNTLAEWRCANGHMTNYGQAAAATITLPAAKEGMRVRFTITTTGFAYHIKAAAADCIYLNGTKLDDADKVSNAVPAVGDSILFTAFRSGAVSDNVWAYDWIARSEGGTWIDGGA